MEIPHDLAQEVIPDLQENLLPDLTREQRETAKQVAQAVEDYVANQKPVTLEQARELTPAHLRYAHAPSVSR